MITHLCASIQRQERRWQNSRGGRHVQNETAPLFGHFRHHEERHAGHGENVAVHESRADIGSIRQNVQELREIVRHADIVDEDADVEILQLRVDAIVNLSSAREIDVDNAGLHAVLTF